MFLIHFFAPCILHGFPLHFASHKNPGASFKDASTRPKTPSRSSLRETERRNDNELLIIVKELKGEWTFAGCTFLPSLVLISHPIISSLSLHKLVTLWPYQFFCNSCPGSLLRHMQSCRIPCTLLTRTLVWCLFTPISRVS